MKRWKRRRMKIRGEGRRDEKEKKKQNEKK